MRRRSLYVYLSLLSFALLGAGPTSGHSQEANAPIVNPSERAPAQVESSYQFEPPPPPDDSSDFAAPDDDSMQTGDDIPQAPPAMPPPPPPTTQYYQPNSGGKMSSSGQGKIHFKLVTGEFWEKGKKRPRGKIQR